MSKRDKRGLGRGLSALMQDIDVGTSPTPNAAPAQDIEGSQPAPARRADTKLPIERIRPNPEQPRRNFTPEALEELAASIKEKGIIQPLIVRADPNHDGDYQMVAGERRWRASQMGIPYITNTSSKHNSTFNSSRFHIIKHSLKLFFF